MAVEIELDLDAGSAMSKIGLLKGQLAQLEEKVDDLDDLDFDFDSSISDIASEIQTVITKLERLEARMDDLGDNIRSAARELDDVTVDVEKPDGSTGSGPGGENDPPDGDGDTGDTTDTSGFSVDLRGAKRATADGGFPDSFSASKLTSEIEQTFNFERGSLTNEAIADVTKSELNDAIAETLVDLRDVDEGTANLGRFAVSDDLLFNEGGTIGERETFDLSDFKAEFRNQLLNLDWRSAAGAGISGRKWLNFQLERNHMEALSESLDNFEDRLRSLKPTMGKYRNVLATLYPMLGIFAVEALGAAAALGAVAAAGASVIGLGLLGHAESYAGAMKQAEQRTKDFKRELFEVFQPTMRQFAPIQSRLFDFIPDRLQSISRSMRGLTAYEDTLFSVFNIGTAGLRDLIEVATANERIIGMMATQATEFIATGLPDFFEWLTQSAYENWSLMMDLGATFVHIAIVAYNVAMAISRIVETLRPVFAAFAALSGLLNNELIMGLLTFVTIASVLTFTVGKLTVTVYTLYGALLSLKGLLMFLGGGSILAGVTTFFSTVLSYISATIIALYEMYGAAVAAASALAMTGVGALIVGGGALAAGRVMSSMSNEGVTEPSGVYDRAGVGSMSGREVVYNDNRSYEIVNNGEMDNASEQRIRDVVRRVDSEDNSMEPPTPDTGSTTSNDNERGA